MKISAKKIFCSNCRVFMVGEEQTNNGQLTIVCPRCKNSLYIWNGSYWRVAREERSTAKAKAMTDKSKKGRSES